MASDTVTAVAEPRTLESLSPTQYNEWRKTGEIPADTKEPSEPKAIEKEPEAKTEPAAESETAAPKQEKVSKLGYADLRKKVREQDAEIARLKASPREEKTEPVKVEPKDEKSEPRPRQTDADKDGKPKYQTWEDYEDALLAWNRKESLTEFEKTQTKRQQEAEIQKTNRALELSWKERVDKAKEAHADFDAALDPKDGPGADIQGGSFLDRWILESDQGAELLYHFHENRAELKRIGAMSVTAAARELSKLESKLSGESSAPPAQPEPKKTKVPPPAKEVGGRGTTAGDEVTKAVADDDFTAFKNAQNRAELARHKR